MRAGVTRRQYNFFFAFGTAVNSVNNKNAVAQLQGGLNGFGKALTIAFIDGKAVDNNFYGMFFLGVQCRQCVNRIHFAVNTRTQKTKPFNIVQLLLIFAFAIAHHRGEQHNFLFVFIGEQVLNHLACGFRFKFFVVLGAVGRADAREQQAQVVIDFGNRADGRARVVRRSFLFYGDCRRQTGDVVDIGFVDAHKKLARIRRQRLNIASLTFGKYRIKSERRFSRTRQAGNNHKLIARDDEVNIL